MKKNNAKIWAVVCLIVSLAGIVLVITGMIQDKYETMWMLMVGLMIFLTFIICFGIFAKQAAKLRRLFDNKDILAHWVYMDGDSLADKEKKTRYKNNLLLIALITAFFVIFTVLFAVFGFDDIEDALFFIGLMAVILAILWAAALLSPSIAAYKMKRSAKEAYIAQECAWVMGEFYYWRGPLMRLKNIGFFPSENTVSYIELAIETFQRTGRQTHTVRIPVPRGEEVRAQYAVSQIGAANGLS